MAKQSKVPDGKMTSAGGEEGTSFTAANTAGLSGAAPTAAEPDGPDRTVKVSVALPRRLWEEARATVGAGSLSALVTAAVRRELAGRRTDAMLAALDDIHGPVPADVQAEVDTEWRDL